MRLLHLILSCALPTALLAQGAEPFVDYWDAKRGIKKSEGLMVNGREWGEWRFYDREGHLIEHSEFKAGERDGHVRIYYPGPSPGEGPPRLQHDGFMRRGVQDSTITSYYANGQVMERGAYSMGVKSGPWEYFYPDGRPMLKERWSNGIPIVTDAWDRDGEQTVKQGDGWLRAYYPSGAVSELKRYRAGVPDGEQVEYWPAGNIKSQGHCTGGLRNGQWKWYGSNGKPEKETAYVAGKLHGPYTAFRADDGSVDATGWHKADKKDSLWTWYAANGKPEMSGPFKEGLREGVWKHWHPNGQLQGTGAFKADKEQGEWVYYYEGG
ncbi:MAG: toxin-antitoxin system YwqK family antitoxin, partial [Flavobacteriales bacterium]